jgi:2-oxoglutarate dehydrogenase E1 component
VDRFSTMYASNSDYVESIFEQFQQDPNSVSHEWRTFFESVKTGQDIISKKMPSAASKVEGSLQNRVSRMINAYRNHGHKYAHLDPLSDAPELGADLSLAAFNLTDADLNQTVDSDGLLSSGEGKLCDLVEALKTTYCNRIGVQYALTSEREERKWLAERMEKTHNMPSYSKEQKQRMFRGLVVSSQFEKFLHTKFVGMKRFSVEGGEALIPMLDTMMDVAGDSGVSEVIMGMAHRGRLNVLANTLDKPLAEIMAAFNEKLVMEDDFAMGDVKYHMGKSYDVKTRSGHDIHVSLHNNPSHLEQVNPVVCGSARAKQDKIGDEGQKRVMPVTIHGDSAFAGQGIVAETLNLANLEGFTNGGTMHIIINNQIGLQPVSMKHLAASTAQMLRACCKCQFSM